MQMAFAQITWQPACQRGLSVQHLLWEALKDMVGRSSSHPACGIRRLPMGRQHWQVATDQCQGQCQTGACTYAARPVAGARPALSALPTKRSSLPGTPLTIEELVNSLLAACRTLASHGARLPCSGPHRLTVRCRRGCLGLPLMPCLGQPRNPWLLCTSSSSPCSKSSAAVPPRRPCSPPAVTRLRAEPSLPDPLSIITYVCASTPFLAPFVPLYKASH